MQWPRAWRKRWERGRKGYSVYDWWSFDTYICKVIADACQDFRLHSHGYGNGYTKESWAQYLLSIEEPLRVWGEQKYDLFGDEEMEAYEAAKAAMHRFADELGQMWD